MTPNKKCQNLIDHNDIPRSSTSEPPKTAALKCHPVTQPNFLKTSKKSNSKDYYRNHLKKSQRVQICHLKI